MSWYRVSSVMDRYLTNALLARHDIILLGLRGQAKTRIVRLLYTLLDEYVPVVKGSEINDDPFAPVSKYAVDLIREKGDDAPIEWLHRSRRYGEKLATPDVTIADLIGDIDPIKAASQRLHYAHEGAIHFGIIPRTNRGIFAINELPDLQPRIQVGLFNILEEKDIQIRGFNIRIPLDVMLVFTANPEDYTNRGNIITPLKDRIDSQILTHYPRSMDDAIRITEQEAHIARDGREVRVPTFFAFLSSVSNTTDFNLISSPRILTSDHKEGIVEVGDVVPFATGARFDNFGQPLITYDYKKVGIKLAFTPHVSQSDTLRPLHIITLTIPDMQRLLRIDGMFLQRLLKDTCGGFGRMR